MTLALSRMKERVLARVVEVLITDYIGQFTLWTPDHLCFVSVSPEFSPFDSHSCNYKLSCTNQVFSPCKIQLNRLDDEKMYII